MRQGWLGQVGQTNLGMWTECLGPNVPGADTIMEEEWV